MSTEWSAAIFCCWIFKQISWTTLKTRVVAPLYPADQLTWSLAKLSPRFTIRGEVFVMATQRMVAVPIQEIGDFVADLSNRRDDIVAATDFLFQGF
ncbi:CcdB family protein [Agrobacterium rubi]|uniref:CcdB family protein n=1 Tax=Agrobacterium rubi TaxID=28099 RepID=UPI002E2D3095|nr:CcdB family protein [Agrobacterium rubi]